MIFVHPLGRQAHLEVGLQNSGCLSPQILVAEAAGDLKVFIQSADHAELLELLRALRQYEEVSGYTRDGTGVFASAFWRALL